MAGLYPHHPLLRRWKCGGEREQRRMPTSGVDLAVAELRTSGGAGLSGGGHLHRPPPQLLAGLHLISSSTLVVPSRRIDVVEAEVALDSSRRWRRGIPMSSRSMAAKFEPEGPIEAGSGGAAAAGCWREVPRARRMPRCV
ncbi:unnamed protein product [Urochloa humidicola]